MVNLFQDKTDKDNKKHMKKILTILTLIISVITTYGQHLYPEKFEGCELTRFCLDCGEPKAQPPTQITIEISKNLDLKTLKKISGIIEVQIIVDTLGSPCLLSAKNESNVKIEKLNLKYAIDNTSKWTPASKNGKPDKSSVSLKLIFENESFSIQRVIFDFTKSTNQKSVGTPDVKGTKASKLTSTWTVFNQQNSDLPWDMSRAVITDNDNVLWFGTDNGIVKFDRTKMEVFTCKNTPLKSEKYNKNRTTSVSDAAVDSKNNKWFIAGWDVYKFDGENWTNFDSLNSPINWARKIFVDKSNNVWFTSWDGVAKYDGEKWSVINTTNSKLPSNKTLGVFVDSKNRLWIGTFDGNIRIDNSVTVEFNTSDTPLKKGSISQMYEDRKGNLWFDLYNDDDKSYAGIFVLKNTGEWESIKPKNTELFNKNDINYFLLDEEKNILWIALNSVGLIKYDIKKDQWETYTPENSNIPSIHVMQLTKDHNGIIWAATFAGIVRINEE
jgi:ligand-binding sensor domain-containing protein